MNRYRTRRQLADEMGISERTLRRWLKNEEIRLKKRLISPMEADRIFKTFEYRLKKIDDYRDNRIFK